MNLIFSHFSITGASGTASALIPGPVPKSNLDIAPHFSIQAGFKIVQKDSYSDFKPQSEWTIPGTSETVQVMFIVEEEVPGTNHEKNVDWPASKEYRDTFTRMLANMLSHRRQSLSD
jgi:hypothetical protein